MADPKCKTCGETLEAVVTWVHVHTPERRHAPEPEDRAAIEHPEPEAALI